MITPFTDVHSQTHALQTLFHYIDGMDVDQTPYKTGRPPFCRKMFLKSFFLKAWFRLDSLRKLIKFLKAFPYFSHLCGFSTLPHLSTFARAAIWFREEGYESISLATLLKMGLASHLVAIVDSTALRSSLYDSQAKWGKSTRLKSFKGYKLHLCISTEGVILSHAFVPANRYDSVIAPSLLRPLKEYEESISFVLGDAAYDTKDTREVAEDIEAMMITPINPRNGQRKDSYGRVMPALLETSFGAWLFGLRNEIERVFHLLKDQGLENPRIFGYNRYHFHVQILLLMHNIGCLL
jgi:hypothetical protein